MGKNKITKIDPGQQAITSYFQEKGQENCTFGKVSMGGFSRTVDSRRSLGEEELEQNEIDSNANGFHGNQHLLDHFMSTFKNEKNAVVDSEENKNVGQKGQIQLLTIKGQSHCFQKRDSKIQTGQADCRQVIKEQKQKKQEDFCSGSIKIDTLKQSNKNVLCKIRQTWKADVSAQVEKFRKEEKEQLNSKKELSKNLLRRPQLQFSIPQNKQVENILQQAPLRQRYGYLIQKQDRYLIGHNHRLLLSLLRDILSTISFLSTNKPKKSCFLTELKKNININSRIHLTHKTIQQLQFIDDSFFKVEWEAIGKNRDNQNEYDLLITLLQEEISLDYCVAGARRKIVEYLMTQELEYRTQNNILSGCVDKWVDGFDPSNYQIKEKRLPKRPDYAAYSLSSMTMQEISKIKNEPMKEICLRKKKEEEAQSCVSSEVASIIFSKKDNQNARQILYKAIQEKEERLQEEMKRRPSELVDCNTILTIIDSVMLAYTGRSVSFMARSNLIGILEKQGICKREVVVEAIRVIVGVKEIGFLTEQTTSSNIKVLKFNKGNFSAMRKHFQK